METPFKKLDANTAVLFRQNSAFSIALKKTLSSVCSCTCFLGIARFRSFFALFCFALLFQAPLPLYGFPPRTLVAFEQNVLRLLKTGQYTVLTEYFEKYYPLQVKNSNAPTIDTSTGAGNWQKNSPTGDKLIEKVVQELPIIDLKLRILNHAISKKKLTKTHHLLHCYMAEQLAFENDHGKAIEEFMLCPSEKRFFFLAQSHEALGQDALAIKNYRRVVSRFSPKKTTKATKASREQIKFRRLAIIALAKLYANQGKFQQSLYYAKQIETGVKREMALYVAHFGSGKTSLAKQNLQNIKKKYSKTLVGKAFLEKNK